MIDEDSKAWEALLEVFPVLEPSRSYYSDADSDRVDALKRETEVDQTVELDLKLYIPPLTTHTTPLPGCAGLMVGIDGSVETIVTENSTGVAAGAGQALDELLTAEDVDGALGEFLDVLVS